jgi:hypothetical protein
VGGRYPVMNGAIGTIGTPRISSVVHPRFIGAVHSVQPVRAANHRIVCAVCYCVPTSYCLYHLYHLYQEITNEVVATTYGGTGAGTGISGGCTEREAVLLPPCWPSLGRASTLREALYRTEAARRLPVSRSLGVRTSVISNDLRCAVSVVGSPMHVWRHPWI